MALAELQARPNLERAAERPVEQANREWVALLEVALPAKYQERVAERPVVQFDRKYYQSYLHGTRCKMNSSHKEMTTVARACCNTCLDTFWRQNFFDPCNTRTPVIRVFFSKSGPPDYRVLQGSDCILIVKISINQADWSLRTQNYTETNVPH